MFAQRLGLFLSTTMIGQPSTTHWSRTQTHIRYFSLFDYVAGQTPEGGFLQSGLETLLGTKKDSDATKSNSTTFTKAGYARINDGTKKFSGGTASPVVIAESACFVVLFVMGLCISRRRHRQLRTSQPTTFLPL